MIYKNTPEIEEIYLGSTAIGKIFNGSSLVFDKNSPHSGDYIIFEDPDVKSIIVNEYGDTTIGEITYGQAAAVTSFMSGSDSSANPLHANIDIDTFDEFTYFKGVTSIGDYTFAASTNMTSITIPNSVTSIGQSAFGRCSSLTSVFIPNSVTYIGLNVFDSCTSLTSITIPNSVTFLGDAAFDECTSLTSVNLSNSITYIQNFTFHNCSALPSITIPTSVTSIGRNAFQNCTSLTSVTIPANVTKIDVNAFFGCSGLTSVTFGNSLKYIYGGAFYGCSGLTSITIPSSVTLIDIGAFEECTSLTSITCNATTPPILGTSPFNNTNNCPIYVPSAKVAAYKAAEGWSDYASRIQAIPNYISFADPDVKSIIVEKYGSNGEITDAQAAAVTTWFSGTDSSTNPFYNNTDVNSFDEFSYFTGLTQIGGSAFRNCSNLTSIEIPANVTSIGGSAFANDKTLTSLTIPAAVTSVGTTVFSNCSSLTSITFLATTPPTITASTFSNSTNCPIYVPAASVNAYKSATRWSNYASRIQALPA